MIYGYARCSTNDVLQDIDRQIRELKQMGAEKIFNEYESGTKTDREQLQAMMNAVQQGDTIIALEVSRITRSTQQLCEIINIAKEKQIKLIMGTFVVDCTEPLDPMTEGMLKMMGVFAELERNMISQRIKSGMRNAKAKGSKLGRPETTAEDIPPSIYKHYPQYKAGKLNKVEFARLCEVSYPTLYKYLRIIEK